MLDIGQLTEMQEFMGGRITLGTAMNMLKGLQRLATAHMIASCSQYGIGHMWP
jgi:hypothetical protein